MRIGRPLQQASEFKNDRSVAWDEEGWHYRDLSSDAGTRRTVQYLFVLDALNFCFWPSPGCVVTPAPRGVAVLCMCARVYYCVGLAVMGCRAVSVLRVACVRACLYDALRAP